MQDSGIVCVVVVVVVLGDEFMASLLPSAGDYANDSGVKCHHAHHPRTGGYYSSYWAPGSTAERDWVHTGGVERL